MEHASYKLSAAKTIHIKMLLQISLGPSFRTYLLKRKEMESIHVYIYYSRFRASWMFDRKLGVGGSRVIICLNFVCVFNNLTPLSM